MGEVHPRSAQQGKCCPGAVSSPYKPTCIWGAQRYGS